MVRKQRLSAIPSEIIVDEFLEGRVSRRQLVAHLTAIGAAAATGGLSTATLAQSSGSAKANGGADGERESTFRATSIDHIALSVTDIARSRDWYIKHIGLRLQRDGGTSCFLDVGERDFLAMFKSDKPGLHHYSFAIPDYNQEDAAKRLREAGLTPKLRGGRTYFDDPDGLEVQVSAE